MDGLHWAAKGGWYKYLPSSGESEHFEVRAMFDEYVHGTPEVRIERWFGNGEIEIYLQGHGSQPHTLFWGSDDAYSNFVDTNWGLIERFPLSSCLVTAGEPKSWDALNRLQSCKGSLTNSTELAADIRKIALERLQEYSYDVLVIDIDSLNSPIVTHDRTYFEATRYARALGIVPVDARIINPGSKEYTAVLWRSLIALLQAARPRPVFITWQNHKTEITDSKAASPNWKSVSLLNRKELGKLGFLDFHSSVSGGEVASQHRNLRELVKLHPFILDEHLSTIERPFSLEIVSMPLEVKELPKFTLQGMPRHFEVSVDVLVANNYRDKNLLLTLDLESQDGAPADENLSAYSIARSKMEGIDYYRYFPSIQGSKTVTFKVGLPDHIRCIGIGIKQVRELDPVFISRIEILSDVIIDVPIVSNIDQPRRG
ncbi:hypothetical protein CAMM_04365 [Corynebacterium ammoniagenes DSM 20306]|nr:hypothetical protein CAMM_04365 [Corynebacterium ammoniagenes DSM 20306]AQS73279.1 hypothetical protein CA40472_04695 [Corynebacterium ammoniagenes]